MRAIFLLLTCVFLFHSCNWNETSDTQKENRKLIKQSSAQLKNLIKYSNQNNLIEVNTFPRSIDANSKIRYVRSKDWTSGFYPGVLWIMYDLTKKNSWKKEAKKYTGLLENEEYNTTTHDLGFKMMSSFGNEYRLTGDTLSRDVLIQSARSLITRFNQNVGCIRSWDHHKDKWEFPVIIDNMMNLELLFFAWRETGEPVFYNVAVKHAKTTMLNHFRKDYSTYHVVSYDTITGAVMAKNTHQGFSDESCWARGEAWALYGYTMVYRETQNPDFLKQAEKTANYILNIAGPPTDFVPYWDFNAPKIPDEPRDASAAAIMASAFYELSTLSENNSKTYLNTANKIMASLSSEKYFNKKNTNGGFLLKHSTGSKPSDSEVDVPIIYADYYYLEALKRKIEIDKLTSKMVNN